MYYVKLSFFPLDQLTKVSFCRRSRKFCRITSMHSSVVDAIQLYEMQTNKAGLICQNYVPYNNQNSCVHLQYYYQLRQWNPRLPP